GRASRLSTRALSRSSPTRVSARRVDAAAGQSGAASSSLSCGERTRAVAGAWTVAQRIRGEAFTNTRRSTAPGSWRPGRAGEGPLVPTATLHPDRMPDRLHLQEGGDPFRPLGSAVIEPVEACLGHGCRAAKHALDV